MSLQILINNEELDLYKDTIINISFQITDFNNLNTLKTNFTNSISIPKTTKNNSIFGFTSKRTSSSTNAYKAINCRVLQSGWPILNNGKALITDISKDYKINIYSGTFDFLDLINSKTLKDLDTTEFDYIVNLNTFGSNVYSTYGLVFPIVNWGSYPKLNYVDIRYSHFGIYVNTLMREIAKQNGFKLIGDALNDDFFTKLIIPFSNKDLFKTTFEANTDVLSEYRTDNNTSVKITFNNVIFNPFSASYLDNTLTINENFTGKFVIKLDVKSATDNFNIVIDSIPIDENSDIITEKFYVDVTSVPNTFTFETKSSNYQALDKIFFSIETFAIDQTIILNSSHFFDLRSSPEAIINSKVKIKYNLPELKQLEFFKNITQIMGYRMQCNNGSDIELISYNSYNSLFSNSTDWSDKLDITSISEKFSFGNYGQKTSFKYTNDDTVSDGLGTQTITIDNENLPEESSIFSLSFSASESQEFIGKYMAIIPRYKYNIDESNFDVEFSTSPRILYVNREFSPLTAKEGNNSLIMTNYQVGKFIQDSLDNNLGFNNNIIQKRYEVLLDILTNMKIITCNLKLDIEDIVNLDICKPVYLDYFSRYYFINKIKNFKNGRTTPVELIEI